MIDEFFAVNAINDYYEKVKNNPDLLLSDDECEAVVSLLSKGKEEFLSLLLEKVDINSDNSAKIKSLFLGRIAINNIILSGFSKKDAIYHLSIMPSPYAKSVLLELRE